MPANVLPPSTDQPTRTVRATVPILIALTLLSVGRLAGHDFTWWDDEGTVHQNPWMHPPTWRTVVHYWTTPEGGLYIPVTYMVWAGVASVAHVKQDAMGIALNPWLFHSMNLLVHLLAVVTVYRLLRLLNAGEFASFCGALLFGIHPVQVEAVGWVSGLKDVLSGLLALLALYGYVASGRADLEGRRVVGRYMLATALFLLAMLAKPAVMALPLAALALDRWAVGRTWRRALPRAIVWVVLAAPIAWIAVIVQDAINTPAPPLWAKPLIATDALAYYLYKLVWPLNLGVDYGHSPPYVMARGWCYWDWVVPAGLAIALAAGARRRPVLLAAGIVFVAGCLPVLGITQSLFEYFSTTADHYLYLSMFGPALALAWVLTARPNLMLRCATLVCLGLFGALAFRQAGFWQNDITLFVHSTKVNPRSYICFINLGRTYERIGDKEDGVAAFRAATLAAPDEALTHSNLADGLCDIGDLDEAIAEIRKSIKLHAEHPNPRSANWGEDEKLGQMLAQLERLDEALVYLQRAVDLQPKNVGFAAALRDVQARATTQRSLPRAP